MTAEQPVASDQFVQSLARGLSVITAFDQHHSEMTLSEVAARTDLSRATARRFLHTLVELGLVRTDGRNFGLTPQVLRLGTAYLSGLGLPALAQPHLERLSAEVGESTSASVLDGTDIVYVARVATRRIMSVGITVGTRFPAHATSMGRVLLAAMSPPTLDAYFEVADLKPLTPRTIHDEVGLRRELDEVRAQGWCYVDQELELGLRSVAVPVADSHGDVIAAINVSAATASEDDLLSTTLPALQRAAEAVTADLAQVDGPRLTQQG